MNIDFIYSGYGLTGGPRFDPRNLMDSPQGLSGTEVAMLGNAFELARRGHQVSVHARWTEDCVHGGVAYKDLDTPSDGSDVAVAWHDARLLRNWNTKRKVSLHQSYGLSTEEENQPRFSDYYLTATERVAAYHRAVRKWEIGVVPNGWNLGTYRNWSPVKGRIIYTTSVERGFHRLMEAFPKILQAVPEAHIQVFYRGGPALPQLEAHVATYGKDRIQILPPSSRNDVLKTVATAAVMAYPCDTPAPCEVWPVSVTEACATGVPVVLAPDDGIEEVFRGGVELTPSIKENPDGWMEPFVAATVRALTDTSFAAQLSLRGRLWSSPYTFENSCDILCRLLDIK